MISKVSQKEIDLEFLYLDEKPPEKRTLEPVLASPDYLWQMSRWLNLPKLVKFNEEFVFQFDPALDWLQRTFPRDPELFEKEAQASVVRKNHREALYRIHHFDTEKEGDTCRTRFVHKIRKILDERDFIPEFKQMWEDVKSGKIEVKDPWKR